MTVIQVQVVSELGIAEEEEDRRQVERSSMTQPQMEKLIPFTSHKQPVPNYSALVMPYPMSFSLTFLEMTSSR